jgi:hypothetical protein
MLVPIARIGPTKTGCNNTAGDASENTDMNPSGHPRRDPIRRPF